MRLYAPAFVSALTAMLLAPPAQADRVMTSPATDGTAAPVFQFFTFDLAPNGSTIIANAHFDAFSDNDQIYSLPVPADPATDTVAVTAISTQSFVVPAYDTERVPVISPDGTTVLFTHNRGSDPDVDTIHTMPIAGEAANDFYTGLFGGVSTGDPTDNLVLPGTGNRQPLYAPTSGSTIVFINDDAGDGGAERLFSVPAAGGAATALTPATDDIDVGLYAFTPDDAAVIYTANDNNQLFSQPIVGGAPTQINITPSAVPSFDIDQRLTVTPDGQSILFIGDYFVEGQNELLSTPIGGGAVTRISDTLPTDGDVTNFEISPDGTQVAYAAGQNSPDANELFLTPITGGTGNSIRVSNAPAVGDGSQDVATGAGRGFIHWSPDGTQIFYIGDQTTSGVNDLYIVDTSAKGGLVPAQVSYTYVGASAGSFYTASNWEDASQNNPAQSSLTRSGDVPTGDIEINLIIDGSTVTADGDLDYGNGGSGSLTLINGAQLDVSGDTGFDFDIDSDATFVMTDSTLTVPDNVFFGGAQIFTNATLDSGDDIDFQASGSTTITGGTFTAADDIELFSADITIDGAEFVATASGGAIEFKGTGSATITNATFTTTRFSIESESSGDDGTPGDISVTDSTITVTSNANDTDGNDAGTLTLLGDSSFRVNALQEGFDLRIDGESDATITQVEVEVDDGNGGMVMVPDDYLGGNGDDGLGASVTLLSTDATLTVSNLDVFDALVGGLNPRDFIFNDMGMSLAQAPDSFELTMLEGGDILITLTDAFLPGDADGDGDVDGDDLIAVQTEFGATGATPLLGDADGDGDVDGDDLIAVQTEFGSTLSVAVPEPSAIALLLATMAGLAAARHRV